MAITWICDVCDLEVDTINLTEDQHGAAFQLCVDCRTVDRLNRLADED